MVAMQYSAQGVNNYVFYCMNPMTVMSVNKCLKVMDTKRREYLIISTNV